MDAQDLRNLQEAYMGVVMNEGLGGATGQPDYYKYIDGARKNTEASAARTFATRRRQIEAKKAQEFLEKHPRKKRTSQKEQVDLYYIILSHLINEGYAETEEAALAIMVNMSEEWRDSIV